MLMNIVDLKDERVLVAADIHGNWESYQQVLGRFDAMKRSSSIDLLVFTGDLIHGYPGYPDESVKILDDLMEKKDDKIISILGNHELMHIYHMSVGKGDLEFVPGFEAKIKQDRSKYIGFMKNMAYAVRTSGGVTINHTGASPVTHPQFSEDFRAIVGAPHLEFMKWLKHDNVLDQLARLAARSKAIIMPYQNPDKYYDPAIGQALHNSNIGEYLWATFFNKNENEFGQEMYNEMTDAYLKEMGSDGLAQRILISGHVGVPHGSQIVNDKQLRLGIAHTNPEDKTLAVVESRRFYESPMELLYDIELLR
jgi:hypothetical protein